MPRRPRISICIVTGRRLPQLDACLASLAGAGRRARRSRCSSAPTATTRSPTSCTGGSRRPGCASWSGRCPGAGRNLLVDEARGDLLLFLDDDVTVEPDLLARLDRLADEHPEAGVFGGPNDSAPDSTRFQFVQGAVLASIVGSGPVRRRYGAHPAGLRRRAVLRAVQPRRAARR